MLNRIVVKELDGTKKTVGTYCDDTKIFSTTRNTKKHLLRNRNAWAIDKKLLVEVLVPDEASIYITDETGKVYTITAKEMLEQGTTLDYQQHRLQVCLNREAFTIK